MKKIKAYLYRDIGIILCVLFYISFMAVARIARPHLDGAGWYFFSSMQRGLFGLAELAVFIKLFHKGKWTNVISFTHFKDGIFAGSGLIVYTVLLAAAIAAGAGAMIDTTFAIVFSCLICQQLTTGFWEELTFRAFLLEGYANKTNRNRWCRLAYAGISFVVFGLIHAVECGSFADAVDKFLTTGAFGFAFAAVYLYSHNILVPMLLHFIYDIPANFQQFVAVWNEEYALFNVLNNYVLPAAFILIPVVSLIFIVKTPVYERGNMEAS